MRRRLPQHVEELAHLPAAFGAEKAEMRHDDAQPRAANVEVDVERVARLAAPIAEREAPHFQHFAAGGESGCRRGIEADEPGGRECLPAHGAPELYEPRVAALRTAAR